MPLPQKHLQRLSVDMRNHDRELQNLEASPQKNNPNIRTEIEFHQTVLQVGRDPKILAALGDLYDNPALADEIQRDGQAFVRARGIRLPASAIDIVAGRPTPRSSTAAVQFHVGFIHFGLQWSSEHGFSIYQLP